MFGQLLIDVDVWGGDGRTYLGKGKYVGDVSVYSIAMPDGSLRSMKNAEEKPSDEIIKELGGVLHEISRNPKIILDNGSVVYGCQVWWQPAKN